MRRVVLGIAWLAIACGESAESPQPIAAAGTGGAAAASAGAGAGGAGATAQGPSAGTSAGTVATAGRAGTPSAAGSPASTSAGTQSVAGSSAGASGDANQAGQAGQAGTAGQASSAGAGVGGATAGAAGSSTAPAEPRPDARFLPAATGPCPEFRDGYVNFAPGGMQRRVLLYMSEQAMSMDGPLIFSWHSTLPNPEDTTSWLGRSVIEQIRQMGGIVAAPTTGYPRETRPWDNTPMGAQNTDGDQRLMDEIVACAQEKVGIDLRHIHATGMSAGGLKTAQVSLRRSGYLASVVVYSGGLTQGDMPPDQNPDNKLAAMILYGGPSDISPVDGINYPDASRRYRDLLRSQGRFAFLCNHGGGHSVPSDSQASAFKFMQDHPFGTPSPYATALPSGFLRYCSLQ